MNEVSKSLKNLVTESSETFSEESYRMFEDVQKLQGEVSKPVRTRPLLYLLTNGIFTFYLLTNCLSLTRNISSNFSCSP